MKSFVAGLITIVILGLAGFYGFRELNSFVKNMNISPSPSPVSSALPSSSPVNYQKPSSSSTPAPSASTMPTVPTTKGGVPIKTGTVKGVTTSKTVTTTTSHLTLTLVKTSICPISYMTEVRDIKGPLTLRYKLIDNTSFGITIWAKDGNELLNNTTYSGNSGAIKTISGVDYMKVRVESKSCAGNNDNWLTLTAER